MASRTKTPTRSKKYFCYKFRKLAILWLKVSNTAKNDNDVVRIIINAVEKTLFLSTVLLKNLKKAVSIP